MIRLTQPASRRPENIVPMINVAFLLLIFFLMTAVIAPQDPVKITPPQGEGAQSETGEIALYLEADGTLWKDGQARAALGDLANTKVDLRVARDLPASALAQVLQRVRNAGAQSVNLVVARP